jgi:hypothetical protein
MKTTHKILAFLFTVGTAAHAQVEPAATGPGVPLPSGNLNYSFHYSQSAQFGSSLGDWQTANASADVTYANSKERLPFSLTYGGGYTFTIAGPSYGTGLFQHLFLSQGIQWRKWNATVSDSVSYLPQAPTTGFSGIPGTGEPIGGPNPSPPSGQTILTLKTSVVDNAVNGQIEHNLNFATSVNAGGSSSLLRYPDGNGLNTNSLAASAGVTQRLNARNSLTARYTFSEFSYPDYSSYSLMTNSGQFGFKREWSRKITTNLSVGPQWTGSLDSTVPPTQTTVGGNASVIYQYHFVSAGLTYSRGVIGGSGFLLGAESDDVSANYSQDFGKNLTIGLSASYMRTSGLQNSPAGQPNSAAGLQANQVIDGEFGGVQVTRRLGRYLTLFAGYTATDQSSNSALPSNVLGQMLQGISFGIGYSPRETRLRH